MAQYPNAIPTFSTKQNVTSVVDASHPNVLQDEIRSIALELGTTPKASAFRGITYADVDARLEAIEAEYRLLTNHDSHAALGGLSGDDHTQYLRTDGTRAPSGVGAMTAAPIAVQAGDTQGIGAQATLSRSDHRHAVATAAPAASAVTDTQTEGTSQSFARADHKHAREGFGAVTAATATGQAAANGTAATVARSDHTHGTPALSNTASTTQAVGDAAAAGTGAAGAREDHRHGMPAFGAVTAETSFGIAAANGTAATLARSDHTHGTPSLATTVTDERTWGIAPAVGTSPKAAREDHTHGSPDATLRGPTGAVCMWPVATPPTGWLICDGSAVSRTTYAALYAVIGTTYGAGDGSTTFNLPDIRGKVILGSGQGSGLTNRVLASTGGAETHTLAIAETPQHNHTVNNHSHGGGTDWRTHGHWTDGQGQHKHSVGGSWGGDIGFRHGGAANGLMPNPAERMTFTDMQDNGNHGHNIYGDGNHNHGVYGEAPATDYRGSSGAHNNMQPWLAMPFIIKT